MTTSLVIGAQGYVGRALMDSLPLAGIEVTGAGRRPGPPATVVLSDAGALDTALRDQQPHQVVMLPQLQLPDADWLIDRIDGPRWIVLSSAQVSARTSAPGSDVVLAREELALQRGAVVLRPTMIYGRGGDVNITRTIRFMRRWHLAPIVGDGTQLVQPLHVDDLCALIATHSKAVGPSGRFEVAGPEALPVRELLVGLSEILGTRVLKPAIPSSALPLLARAAGLAGLRGDQILRLIEDKTAATEPVREAFGWEPKPLFHRLEQACREADALEAG